MHKTIPSPALTSQTGLRIGLLTNMASTRNLKAVPDFRRSEASGAAVVHVMASTPGQCRAALKHLAHDGVDVLAINGGDGTVRMVAEQILLHKIFDPIPPLVVLAGGKTNMIAADVGRHGRPDTHLAAIVARMRVHGLERMPVQERPILKISTDGQVRYGFFFGTAGIIRGMLWCRRHLYGSGIPGAVSNFASLVVLLGQAAGTSRGVLRSGLTRITWSGGSAEPQHYAIILATGLERLLFGLRPFPRQEKAMKLTAVVQKPKAILHSLIRLVFRRFEGLDPRYGLAVSESGSVICTEDPITLDGELYESGDEVEIVCGPRLRFLTL